MKALITIEEVAQLIAGIFLLYWLPQELSWWAWTLLFFSPDISMLGYLINKKAGAITYNLFHHKGIAIAVGLTGILIQMDVLTLAGALLFAHSCFDRIWGYGLKYGDDFKHTHLGWMK